MKRFKDPRVEEVCERGRELTAKYDNELKKILKALKKTDRKK